MIEFAALFLGIKLRPWQKWLLIHALELLEDGRYRFRKVVIIVGRQNGKTKLIEVLALWWLFVDSDSFPEHLSADEFLVLGTAQDKDTAKKVWKRVLRRCNPNVEKWPGRFSPAERAAIVPALVSEAMPPSESNGSEAIVLKNGAQYQIAASTSGGGRGDSISRAVLDELREQKNWDGWAALSKTLNGTFNSQMWAISSAGDAKSVVLKDIRDAAIAALDEWQRYVDQGIASVEEFANTHDVSIGLFEWSAPEDCRLDDPDAYLQSNPSIGYGYEVDTLLSDLASGEPEHVTRTEVLGIWVTASVTPYLDVEAWPLLADGPDVSYDGQIISTGSEIAPKSPVVLGVDTSSDRKRTWIGVAGWRVDGLQHLEVIDVLTRMTRVPDRVKAIADEWGIEFVAVQARGCNASELAEPLRKLGLQVIEVSGPALGAGTGKMLDRVADRRMRHRGQEALDQAVKHAVAKKLNDVKVWDREASPVDIAPLVAVSNAAYGLEAMPEVEASAYEDHGLLVA
ncbi:terminase [Microbacterium luteum]|uniref:terminase n=1 Tax=Microbacterium luteum TaxID=2782167 RepID=UPI0018880135|nr:terminase [Microbacterium luteum]